MPADDVFINLTTETKKSIGNLAKYAIGITAAIVIVKKMLAVTKKLEEAFFVQEKAEAKLNAAIRATGKISEISTAKLKALASGLQKVTTFGDEATLSAMAMVQQLASLNQDGLEQVTPAILDFAAAMDVDLQTAATLVGKTLGSTTNALARYGIEIDATASQADKLTALTDAMNEKFKGTARALGDTAFGATEKLKNAMGDLREEMGRVTAEGTVGFKRWLTGVITHLAEAAKQSNLLKQSFKDFTLIGGTEEQEIAQLDKRLEGLNARLRELKIIEDVGRTRAAGAGVSAAMRNRIQSDKQAVALLIATEREIANIARARAELILQIRIQTNLTEAEAEQVVKAAAATKKYEEEMQRLNDAFMATPEGQEFALLAAIKDFQEYGFGKDTESAKRLAVVLADLIRKRNELAEIGSATGGGPEAPAVVSMATGGGPFLATFAAENEVLKEQIKIVEDLEQAYMNAGKNILGFMDTAFTGMAKSMGASEKEMFQIHKLFSAARAAVNVIEATTKAWTIHPLLGVVTGLTGAAAVGSILAQQPPSLGEGGIVRRPTMALIGERGPEAVVPLGAGGALGSTNITMHVYGTVQSETQLAGFVASVMARARRGH